jgi:hypothetical protein
VSLEAWGDEPWDSNDMFTEDQVAQAFIDGARACREMMARFVEQGGDAATAQSIRANWNPAWGDDPGKLDGEIYQDAWDAA